MGFLIIWLGFFVVCFFVLFCIILVFVGEFYQIKWKVKVKKKSQRREILFPHQKT